MSRSVPFTVRWQIARDLGVSSDFNVPMEIERRVSFLSGQLLATGRSSLIIRVGGGIDSATAGLLCRLATWRIGLAGDGVSFVAVRISYGNQRDEAEVSSALEFVRADRVIKVDVGPPSDSLIDALCLGGFEFSDDEQEKSARVDVIARQRMAVLYAIADGMNGLVVGTDHAAKAAAGLFTKHGDSAADVVPLAGLTRRRIVAMAEALGVPDSLIVADLEEWVPARPEHVLGVTYEDIDNFLEGKRVQGDAARIIFDRYLTTAQKRRPPIAPLRTDRSI